jgi:DNA invertase Pin-like site-specific DNA recombinase
VAAEAGLIAVAPPETRKNPAPGRLIGYARVSTEAQGTDPQLDALRAAGCQTVREEHASGADRSRPVLAQLLHAMAPGETLVVVRLDRLARSVSHLLTVIEQLEARGAHFRSLRDPIDTTTPQGMFSLQVLGAVAQLERALIAERTKSGLSAARVRGRVGGNPGLRARDPDAIRKLRASRDTAHLDGVLARLDVWLPTVRRRGSTRRSLTTCWQPPPSSPATRNIRPHSASAPNFRRWWRCGGRSCSNRHHDRPHPCT